MEWVSPCYGLSKYYFNSFSVLDSSDHIKNMTTGATKTVGGIFVVAAIDGGPMPQTQEHILLAKQVGITKLVVLLNKCDMVDDEELLEMVEIEILELLEFYDFDTDGTPIIQGSALAVAEGITESMRDLDKDFFNAN